MLNTDKNNGEWNKSPQGLGSRRNVYWIKFLLYIMLLALINI